MTRERIKRISGVNFMRLGENIYYVEERIGVKKNEKKNEDLWKFL